MNKICIVGIVTYNGEAYIQKCLNSILEFENSYDIFVIDNNSTDNTVSILESYAQSITLLKQTENIGFGQANNIIFEYALSQNYHFVFLLNQDTYLLDQSIDKLIQYAKKDTSGLNIYSPIHLSNDEVTLDKSFSLYISSESKDLIKEEINFIKTTFVNAAAWLIPKDVLTNLGGFNPLFFHYGEDRDLANRLCSKSGVFIVYKQSKIVHDRKYSPMSELSIADPGKFQKRYLLLFTSYLTSLRKPLFYNFLILIKSTIHLFFKNTVKFRFRAAYYVLYNFIHCIAALPRIYRNRKRAKKPFAFLSPPS